jgi:hypothetical protein
MTVFAALSIGEIAEWILIVGFTTLFVINRVRRFRALRRRRR